MTIFSKPKASSKSPKKKIDQKDWRVTHVCHHAISTDCHGKCKRFHPVRCRQHSSCPRGEQCTFLHPVCRHWARHGSCERGDECNYRHTDVHVEVTRWRNAMRGNAVTGNKKREKEKHKAKENRAPVCDDHHEHSQPTPMASLDIQLSPTLRATLGPGLRVTHMLMRAGVTTKTLPKGCRPERSRSPCSVCLDDGCSTYQVNGTPSCTECLGYSLIDQLRTQGQFIIGGEAVDLDTACWVARTTHQRRLVLSTIKDHYVETRTRRCPTTGCPTRVLLISDEARLHRCGRCRHQWCTSCMQDHNPREVSCNDHAEEQFREVLMASPNLALCPKCIIPIEKVGGCNHVTCTKCRHQFCWNCKRNWSLGRRCDCNSTYY